MRGDWSHWNRIAAALVALSAAALADDAPVVVNEVMMVPESGGAKFVELECRSDQPVDLASWWICDRPSALYVRLLQMPDYTGTGMGPGIVLEPGDFLVISIRLPIGGYSTRPNPSGTTTHLVNIFAPPDSVLRVDENNFSIWDQITPHTPTFDAPTLIRDFLAWGREGVYRGTLRGCVAAAAGIWPDPMEGDCVADPTHVVFAAVSTAALKPQSRLSLNYSEHAWNDPSDYFIAPATEGERNVMPGDLNDDLTMNETDFTAFSACFGRPASGPVCSRADWDADGMITCADWAQFAEYWAEYSELPAEAFAPCARCQEGDSDRDGDIDLRDLAAFESCFSGAGTFFRTLPCGCLDADDDADIDLGDFCAFQQAFTGQNR